MWPAYWMMQLKKFRTDIFNIHSPCGSVMKVMMVSASHNSYNLCGSLGRCCYERCNHVMFFNRPSLDQGNIFTSDLIHVYIEKVHPAFQITLLICQYSWPLWCLWWCRDTTVPAAYLLSYPPNVCKYSVISVCVWSSHAHPSVISPTSSWRFAWYLPEETI